MAVAPAAVVLRLDAHAVHAGLSEPALPPALHVP